MISMTIPQKLLIAAMIFVAAPVSIAEGDVVIGEKLFKWCRDFHTIEQGEQTG